MTRKIARTEEEIDHQLNLAVDAIESGTNLPGMSYEEGVQNAILWLTGDYEDCPIEGEAHLPAHIGIVGSESEWRKEPIPDSEPANGAKSFIQTLTDNVRSKGG